MGYVMGKCEGEGELWHGHVSAVTVAPGYRRQGLAKRLMGELEEVTERAHDGYFVDLFVRESNALAIGMYEKFGYTVYRRVLNYYSGEEDAFDMRKAMRRDAAKKSIVPSKKDWKPWELEWQ
jgi:N-terminal acetyltransferase B complex catalytic subunit